MKKKTLFLILTILAMLVIGGLFLYNKPHKVVKHADADHQFSADSLFDFYNSLPDSANSILLEEILLVNGQILEVDSSGKNVLVILKASHPYYGVSCALDSNEILPPYKIGDSITLKGICKGINASAALEMLNGGDVIIDHSIIQEL
jgi:hypothetical protein